MSTLVVQSREPSKFISFEDFFWFPSTVFKCVGWDLMQTTKKKPLKYLLKALLALNMVPHIFIGYYMLKQAFETIANASEDFLATFKLLPYLTFFIDCNVKSLTFFLNQRRIRNLNRKLQEIYPSTMEAQQDYRIHKHCMPRLARWLINIYVVSCYAIALLPLFVSILLFSYQRFILGQYAAEFQYLKIYPVLTYFFDYRTPGGYAVAIIFEELSAHFRTIINIAADVWLTLFAAQIGMHLEHVASKLAAYEPAVENSKKDNEFLDNIISRHQQLLSLHKDLNSIFSVSLTFYLLLTTISLCSAAVQLVLKKWFFLIFFTFTVFLLYRICAAGERLKAAGDSIAIAAYNSKWYNGSQSYRKRILLIILRAQRETILVPKGAQAVSLETLKIVLSMTYQVFALLQTMLD